MNLGLTQYAPPRVHPKKISLAFLSLFAHLNLKLLLKFYYALSTLANTLNCQLRDIFRHGSEVFLAAALAEISAFAITQATMSMVPKLLSF